MASSFPDKPLLKLKKSSDNKAQIRKNELKGKKLNCSLGFSTVSLAPQSRRDFILKVRPLGPSMISLKKSYFLFLQ